jgi:RimJ/RimL family protein N-acetyltransferase
VEQTRKETGVLKNWSIKLKKTDELIGGISFQNKYGDFSFKDEIGYWLARPFWNKGIMSGVVKKVCTLGFSVFNLRRIEATVFTNNTASHNVLLKAGFVLEGTLKDYCLKDEIFIDANIYAIINK